MNDNVKKIFEMLGVEPYEMFKIKDFNDDEVFRISDDLYVYHKVNSSWEHPQVEVSSFLTGENEIVKLSKKKKLRDLTLEEFEKWRHKNCICNDCGSCPFNNVYCASDERVWVNHKDLYTDKFLDQEVEIPQE